VTDAGDVVHVVPQAANFARALKQIEWLADRDQILRRINFDPRARLGAEDDAAELKPDPIPWPTGLAPKPFTSLENKSDTSPLPKADVLIVTYTTAEGYALADVLTPGYSTSEWVKYRNGWPALKKLIEGDRAPSLESDCAGLWWATMIGDKNVVVVKSDLHPSTDGPKLPMVKFWQQMIAQVQPSLVITTGTAGGVGPNVDLGDVIVGQSVKWDCQKQFKDEPFAHESYLCSNVPLGEAVPLMQVNAHHLPSAKRGLELVTYDVLTTDFFAFDTADDHYGLRAFDPNAGACEMDDAALGLAVAGTSQKWISVRNASDPGDLSGSSLEAEDKEAESIYEKYGMVTSWGSAIACWSFVAAMA
jgi:nucleoside phosphorylase